MKKSESIKRILALTLALCMLFVAGCSKDKDEDKDSKSDSMFFYDADGDAVFNITVDEYLERFCDELSDHEDINIPLTTNDFERSVLNGYGVYEIDMGDGELSIGFYEKDNDDYVTDVDLNAYVDYEGAPVIMYCLASAFYPDDDYDTIITEVENAYDSNSSKYKDLSLGCDLHKEGTQMWWILPND